MWSTRKFKQHRVLKLLRRSWKKQLQVRSWSSEMEQIMHWNFRLPESGVFFFFSYCMHNRTVAYTLVHMHIIICYYHTMCILLALPVCVRCMLHRQTLHYTVAIFHKAWHKSNFLHQNWVYLWSTIILVYKGVQLKIQTLTHWNLIICSMTALLPVLLSISIFLPPSSHCTFILTRKNLASI